MSEEQKTEDKTQKSETKKEKFPEIKPGMIIKVHQKIKELDIKGKLKERVQIFEGIVIACKGGRRAGATFTVRKIAAGGVGVEKIFPRELPSILKIEIVKEHKVRRAKLYYLRDTYKKKLKEKKK